MGKLVVSLILIGIIFLSGCVGQSGDNQAISLCTRKCQETINAGQNLTNGPCLSNEIIPDWVCDVAHEPRQTVDNLSENQCSAYREGRASHFVELDSKCKFIKAV